MFTNEEMNEINQVRNQSLGWIFKTILLIGFVVMLIQIIFAPFNLIGGVAKKVLNPTNIVNSYEWFEETYNQIQSTEKQIQNTQRSLNSTKNETMKIRYETNLLGLQNYKNDLISQYNAKSRMITRNKFKAKDLPYQIGE